jgi:hypothetical protein
VDPGIFPGFDKFPMSGQPTKSTSLPASPTKTLIVALWSVNTQSMQHLTLDARFAGLKDCVYKAHGLAMGAMKDQGFADRPFALFVAPEYLAAQPVTHLAGDQLPPLPPSGAFPMGHSGDRRHIDEAAKDIQLQRYVGLSTTCKGMILVPGTIAWRKPLVRPDAKLLHGNKNRPNFGLPKTVSRYDKALASVQFYQQRQGLGLDQGMAGAHWTGHLPPTTRQKLDALNAAKVYGPLGSVFGYLPGDLQYMARNTAYVLLDGQVLCKYHKQGDFHEVLVGTDTVHIPGRLDGRFPVRPTSPAQREIRFGIEICLDHACQAVEKDVKNMGYVDVHIITSAQLPTDEAKVAAANAGYLVHASSNEANSGVWQRGKEGLKPVKTIWAEPFLGFPLQLYAIELDLGHVVPTKETVETVKGGFWSNVFG